MAYKTGFDLTNEAKARIRQVPADVAVREARQDVVYLDVREPQEWNLGHIPGAVFLPRGTLEGKIEAIIPRDKTVIVYCARGNRSAFAADTMQQMGYSDVASMSGGFAGWVEAGGPVE